MNLYKTLKDFQKSCWLWAWLVYTVSTMKISSAVTEYVKVQLSTNPAWAQRAIVKLWERQTADEQAAQTTGHDNGIGFNGTDAFILSSFAEQINKGRTLSVKQLAIAFKKLPKYSKQIISEIPADKLSEIEKKAVVAWQMGNYPL